MDNTEKRKGEDQEKLAKRVRQLEQEAENYRRLEIVSYGIDRFLKEHLLQQVADERVGVKRVELPDQGAQDGAHFILELGTPNGQALLIDMCLCSDGATPSSVNLLTEYMVDERKLTLDLFYAIKSPYALQRRYPGMLIDGWIMEEKDPKNFRELIMALKYSPRCRQFFMYSLVLLLKLLDNKLTQEEIVASLSCEPGAEPLFLFEAAKEIGQNL